MEQEGHQRFPKNTSHDGMWSKHGRYELCIPHSLSSDSTQLLECQKAILKAGGKRPGSKIQRVHTAGWFEGKSSMALIILKFPLPSGEEVETFPHFPLSYAFERGYLTDAVVLADVGVCVNLDIGDYCSQFAELDEPYQRILNR
jgi:hypothetical protein